MLPVSLQEQQWIQTNHLTSHGMYLADFKNSTTTAFGEVPRGYAYTVYSWKDSWGTEVQVYCKIHGLGHAWSGGSPTYSHTDPHGPNASEVMYQFFMKHQWVGGANGYGASAWKKIQRAIGNPLRMIKIKRAR
jgi:poly(3-hydroxybutyrate) depolymerase